MPEEFEKSSDDQQELTVLPSKEIQRQIDENGYVQLTKGTVVAVHALLEDQTSLDFITKLNQPQEIRVHVVRTTEDADKTEVSGFLDSQYRRGLQQDKREKLISNDDYINQRADEDILLIKDFIAENSSNVPLEALNATLKEGGNVPGFSIKFVTDGVISRKHEAGK